MFEKISPELNARAQKIKLICFDVDGVLTDSSLFIGESGEEFKKYCSLDGYGMRLAMQFDVRVAIISARNCPSVHTRYKGWGFDEDINTGREDKLECLNEICQKYSLELDEVAYIGDDALDIPVLEKVGLAACPPGAHYSVLKHIHYITERAGGFGAARELCDLVLNQQGKIP